MTKLKQYMKAIIKGYWPLILVFVCQDTFAIEVDGDAMDKAANTALKWLNGYGVTGASLVSFGVGGGLSSYTQSGKPIAIGSVIAGAIPIGWVYFGGGKTLLLGI